MTIYIFVSRQQKHVRVVWRNRNSDDVVENYKPATLQKNGGQVHVHPVEEHEDNSTDKLLAPVITVPTSRTIIKYVERLN